MVFTIVIFRARIEVQVVLEVYAIWEVQAQVIVLLWVQVGHELYHH